MDRLSSEEIAGLREYVGYGSTWLGPVLVSGQGSRVTDIDGKSYIDCTAQAWTLALGYNHPEVMEAALAQMRTLPHVRAGYPTLPRLQLAKRLADVVDRTGSFERVPVQRYAFPSDQLHSGRNKHPGLPEDHGQQGRPRRALWNSPSTAMVISG